MLLRSAEIITIPFDFQVTYSIYTRLRRSSRLTPRPGLRNVTPLWAISEREYGKGHGGKYDVIFHANRPMLTHPDKVYPGQVLRIPPLS